MNYLKFSRILTISCLLFLFLGTVLNAQCSYPIVATNCVGACGSPTEINYTVSQPCVAKWRKYCVTNDASSLCPDHNAFAIVLVDGAIVASGNITSVGSSIGFTAKCGSNIKVIATTFYVGGGISCVWLGNVTYSLRQQ